MFSRSALSSLPASSRSWGSRRYGKRPIDTGAVAELIEPDTSKPALPDPWAFVEQVLGWEARHVAGAPGRPGHSR